MANKSKLKNLLLDANQFGDAGVKDIKNKLKEMGKLNVLGSLEDNESEEESDNNEEESDDESEKSSDSAGGVEIEEIIEVSLLKVIFYLNTVLSFFYYFFLYFYSDRRLRGQNHNKRVPGRTQCSKPTFTWRR